MCMWEINRRGFGRDGGRSIEGREKVFKIWGNADRRTNGYKLSGNGNFYKFSVSEIMKQLFSRSKRCKKHM